MFSRALGTLLPLVPKPFVSRIASRYVAGETLEDALEATVDLNGQGCRVTIAILGEHSSAEESDSATEEYATLLDRIQLAGLDANISVKPTHVGLDVDPELCFRNLGRLVEEATRRRSFVRIDMEDRHTTDATLAIYGRLRAHHENIGVVFQSCLRRTLDDIGRLPPDLCNARICKGIYAEPREVAFHSFERIQVNFADAVEALFDRGAYVGIATHDELLIQRCEQAIERRGLPPEAYEFQMLLGVRRGLRRTLQSRKHPMRVYVPYGRDWYGYSLRRMRENPRIAMHVLRALFRPS